MGHYKCNLRDIVFNLFEVNDLEQHLGKPPWADFDAATVRGILGELERLAAEDMAASFAEADRNPPHLVDGGVHLPDGLKRSLDAFYDGGWHLLSVPTDLGGMGAPSQVRWAGQEMMVGANPAAFFYITGALMAVVIGRLGTPDQVEKWAKPMLERRWGGTMVLTEPDAGSDVGAGTTKATHVAGRRRTTSRASSASSPTATSTSPENIVHLVLARPEGAGPGTKGLSMFIVPKFWVEEDGTLGERNGVVVHQRREEDGHQGLGDLRADVRRRHARAAASGRRGARRHPRRCSTSSSTRAWRSAPSRWRRCRPAYLNALEYAKERKQGADLHAAPPTRPRRASRSSGTPTCAAC